jgi:major membrane immunogen (membrane-anchored lipoprotein)
MKKVRCFDDFNEDNDPYGEHDFGAVTVKDEKYFWKIDYYDKEADFHSSDASREDLTRRVLTVTRADEY